MTNRVSICLVALTAAMGLFAMGSAHADTRLGAVLNAPAPIENIVTKVGYDRGYRRHHGYYSPHGGYDELEGYYHKKRYYYHKKRSFIYEQRYKFHERRKDYHESKYNESKWQRRPLLSLFRDDDDDDDRGGYYHKRYSHYRWHPHQRTHPYHRKHRQPKKLYLGLRYDRGYEIYTYAPTYCGGC